MEEICTHGLRTANETLHVSWSKLCRLSVTCMTTVVFTGKLDAHFFFYCGAALRSSNAYYAITTET